MYVCPGDVHNAFPKVSAEEIRAAIRQKLSNVTCLRVVTMSSIVNWPLILTSRGCHRAVFINCDSFVPSGGSTGGSRGDPCHPRCNSGLPAAPHSDSPRNMHCYSPYLPCLPPHWPPESSKARAATVRTIRHSLNEEAAKTLVYAFIVTQFDHCNSVLSGITKILLDNSSRSWMLLLLLVWSLN